MQLHRCTGGSKCIEKKQEDGQDLFHLRQRYLNLYLPVMILVRKIFNSVKTCLYPRDIQGHFLGMDRFFVSGEGDLIRVFQDNFRLTLV